MGRTCGAAHTPIHPPTPDATTRPTSPTPVANFNPTYIPNTTEIRKGGRGSDRPSLPRPVGRHSTIIRGGASGGSHVGVVSDLPFPAPANAVVKVAHIYLMHLRFACGVAGDIDLLIIWDAFSQEKGET